MEVIIRMIYSLGLLMGLSFWLNSDKYLKEDADKGWKGWGLRIIGAAMIIGFLRILVT